MKFSNRQNEKIQLPDGRVIWLARACGVITTVCCYVEGKAYILLAKRGTACPDEIGKWNMPGGYLDWDETLTQAAEREVYEETGVNLHEIYAEEDHVIANHMHQPWLVKSHVNKKNYAKQNVLNYFYLIFRADKLPETSIEYGEVDEIVAAQWVERSQLDQFEYAFKHREDIERFFEVTRSIATK